MRTLGEILEALNDQDDIAKKIQEVNLNSEMLKKQLLDLNNMWKKKAINDIEYKKKMDELNKQLMNQKQNSERNRIAQTAMNRGITPPQQNIL